ncbi:leucyl aminopeptidase [Amycolatopsis sp. ATCC 39116]|uniref:leucyl aminopeptidase n=1 Tax=Amycolatopsis sp. (strain ATCC 39116 / 75iv2) TaxID=385957 RepID=UPI0002F16368|nr:leucyl aminopeptidase [Amycolatopsis sp. ATCC 39116]
MSTTTTQVTALTGGRPSDVVVIGAGRGPAGLAAPADATPLIATATAWGMTGAAGETLRLPAPPGFDAGSVLLVGLGEPDRDGEYGPDALRQAAGVAARALAGVTSVVLALPARTPDAVEAVTLGAVLGQYSFDAYRSARQPATAELGVLTSVEQAAADAAVRRAVVLAQEVNRARDLVNTPANDLYPEVFAAEVEAVGAGHGLAVEVLDEKALAAAGFGGLLGVGQGSVRPPRLVRISYAHPDAARTIALIGKGITYDSGGLSLKPVGSNEIMKRDMSGAAAVFAAVVAAARLEVPVRVSGWLALAENMPSGSATRPGDVLRMYDGRTVEVLNTDAEGRIVLADAIARAAEDEPDVIVDVATLTFAMRMALGNRMFGVMSPSEEFGGRVAAAARRAGEQAWPLPLPTDLRPSLNSPVADIANVGERLGGGLVAGLFLKEFVPDGTPWAHLDIAGPAFHEGEPYGYTPRGGTGAGVRTLVQLVRELGEAGS